MAAVNATLLDPLACILNSLFTRAIRAYLLTYWTLSVSLMRYC